MASNPEQPVEIFEVVTQVYRTDPDYIAEVLRERESIVALTGAGISLAAGVPIYRGADGAYLDKENDTWLWREAYDAVLYYGLALSTSRRSGSTGPYRSRSRDAKGNLTPLVSNETEEEVKYDNVKPKFRLSLKVNANGNAIDFWLAEPVLGFPKATFQPADATETDMSVTGIQELKKVEITRTPSK